MQISAQLYDPNDKEVSGATYAWSFLYPDAGKINGAVEWVLENANAQIAVLKPGDLITNYNDAVGLIYRGAILKCVASIATEHKTFTGYLIIPMRRTREYIGFEGPVVIRYSSSGTQPQYYNAPIGLLDIDENIIYNNIVKLNASLTALDNNGITKFLPAIKQKSNNKYYHLFPKAMYFNDVNYCVCAVIYDQANSNHYLWSQPLLILIDPYGNNFLNN